MGMESVKAPKTRAGRRDVDLTMGAWTALNRQQARTVHLLAKALADGFPDDHVDASGLVFQRHKHHALGGLRLLSDAIAESAQQADGEVVTMASIRTSSASSG